MIPVSKATRRIAPLINDLIFSMNQIFSSKKHSINKAAAEIFASAAVFIAVIILIGHNFNDYEYIDLPIVLSNEEEVVGIIREGLTNRTDQINITFSTKANYESYISELTDELFKKALEPTGEPNEGDYIKFQYSGYNLKYSTTRNNEGGYINSIKIYPSYYTNTAMEDEVNRFVNDFFSDSGIKNLESDYKKICAVHDYILNNCEYDWRNYQLSHRHMKSTAYGALIKKEASCQGYAVALYRLLTEAKIGCRVITGYATSPETGESEYHAWNIVCIKNEWYNLDAAWDDETDSLDYFLKSDYSFSDHEREEEYSSEEFNLTHPMSEKDWDIKT